MSSWFYFSWASTPSHSFSQAFNLVVCLLLLFFCIFMCCIFTPLCCPWGIFCLFWFAVTQLWALWWQESTSWISIRCYFSVVFFFNLMPVSFHGLPLTVVPSSFGALTFPYATHFQNTLPCLSNVLIEFVSELTQCNSKHIQKKYTEFIFTHQKLHVWRQKSVLLSFRATPLMNVVQGLR